MLPFNTISPQHPKPIRSTFFIKSFLSKNCKKSTNKSYITPEMIELMKKLVKVATLGLEPRPVANKTYIYILYPSYKYVKYKSTKRSGVVRRGEAPPKENFYFLKFLSPYPRNLKFFHRCRKIIASPYLPLIPFRQQSSLEEVG